MTQLTDYFTQAVCNELQKRFNITTVEEAQQLDQRKLSKTPKIGEGFIRKLWSIKTEVNLEPNLAENKIRSKRIIIDGLTVLQRNAILDGFKSGRIQRYLNSEYFTEKMIVFGFSDKEVRYNQNNEKSPLYIKF